MWLQGKMIQCRHLVNLQHWVTFSTHAQRSCLRLRLIESVWHHVAVRHSEKPPPSESDIGYCFLFLTVYRIAIPAFVWEVPSTRYVQGNGSDAGIVFQWCFQLPSTNAFGSFLSVSFHRRLLHFQEQCCNRSAVTNCCNYFHDATIRWGAVHTVSSFN